jgi:PAS domain S-box-containing protein
MIWSNIMRDKTEVEDFDERADANLLRDVVKKAADGVILIDVTECVRSFDPACEQLFGYCAAEMIGQHITTLMPSRDHFGHGESREAFTSIGIGKRKDGSTFSMELSVSRTELDGERIFVGIIRDLTRAVEVMRDSELSYRLLVGGVTNYAIYMLDLGGHVTSWNSGAQRIKQYTAAEILGCHFRKFYTEEEVRRGEPEANLGTARRDGRFEANAWRRRKDGSEFWANVVIEPLRNDRGMLVGFAKVTSDITERRRAEQVIRESGERINAIIETIVDGVILIDKQGKIQTFNAACRKLFGYLIDEVVGQNVKMLMPPNYRHEHDSYLGNYRETGVRKIIGNGREVVGQRKDGSTFPMLLSVGEAKQDGEAMFVGIIHDLTERKRTEEQLVQAQKMETVGQLSGGIAHDFNNLLTVIVGNAEFLSEKLRSHPDLKQLADDIGRAGDRGAELTQRLLAFSRRQILLPVEIECNDLLDSMHKLLRRTVREDIEIKTYLDPDVSSAFADPAQLESAVLNIVLNAQDAMPSGGLLTISTANALLDEHYKSVHPEVQPGEYILVSITDDGDGMPKEVIDRVFEPFFTTKEVGKGSGLGLSMVYGFVKQSNGYVTIYSEPGLGTTVRIYLPRLAAGPPRSQMPIRVESVPPPEVNGTVLVVEDDPFVRSYVLTRVQSLGYSVISAVDGNDALRKLRADIAIDILFTDIVMPGGINGWELMDIARQLRPGLPVLLTSGYALETLVKHSQLRAGAIVLTKPYRTADLALRLREVVSVSELLSLSIPAKHFTGKLPLSSRQARSHSLPGMQKDMT